MGEHNTELLGNVTEEELREFYDEHSEIEEAIREWLRYSDGEFADEQIAELRKVIRFEVDAWCNVYAWPAVDATDCGLMASTIRVSIYSYPSTIEDALGKLERYAEGVERIGYWDMPDHFEKAIDKQMEHICDVYAKYFHDVYNWWIDASSDDIYDYFTDDPDEFIRKCPDLEYELEEALYERRKRVEDHRRISRQRRWKRRFFNSMSQNAKVRR